MRQCMLCKEASHQVITKEQDALLLSRNREHHDGSYDWQYAGTSNNEALVLRLGGYPACDQNG